MSNILKHNHEMLNGVRNKELHELANSNDRHETYHKFSKINNDDFHHMKHASSHALGKDHLYYGYPKMVLYNNEDHHVLNKFSDPAMTHHHLLNHLENDNTSGGGGWKSFKKIALKAAHVYHRINNAVGNLADMAKKVPIDDPRYKAVVNGLSAGTKLHDYLLDKIGAGIDMNGSIESCSCHK